MLETRTAVMQAATAEQMPALQLAEIVVTEAK